MSESRPAAAIVLAAGEGTRMKSGTPKVLHGLLGRSLLAHVMAAVAPLSPLRTVVVVGHGRDRVVEHLSDMASEADAVEQREQLGTGDAVATGLDALNGLTGSVIVLSGDTPLLTTPTLRRLIDLHEADGNSATLLTARLPDPTGYGRVLRDDAGAVLSIVEQADADPVQSAVDEINGGIYVFDATALQSALAAITSDNSQGELYLTDVVATLRSDGAAVGALTVGDAAEILGVNDRVQLAQARAHLRDRTNADWMRAGVSIIDPATTWIDVGVTLASDAVIYPQTMLLGTTRVDADAVVGPGCSIEDTAVGARAVVRQTTAIGAKIGADASVGPYTYLRPGTVLGPRTRAGAFVETKNAQVGEGSKIPHLSYVGDAEIGRESNVGAATVVVNYDGVAKHRTVIGDHVRIGSDTMLVAPVEIGDGAYTAAGSVITDDVPPGAMGVGRARQRTIAGWVARKRPGSASAAAADAAGEGPSADSETDPGDNESAAPPPPTSSSGQPPGQTHPEGERE